MLRDVHNYVGRAVYEVIQLHSCARRAHAQVPSSSRPDSQDMIHGKTRPQALSIYFDATSHRDYSA